jgi:hypothetical protein
MEELNAYTFAEFIDLPEEDREIYKAFGLQSKANDWSKGDMIEWEWVVIKQIQEPINREFVTFDDMIEIILLASGKSADEIKMIKWFDVFRFYNYITAGMIRINEIEQQINYEPKGREITAGIDRYRDFGWFVTLDRLAGGDILKYDLIGKQKFCDVFAKLKLNTLDADYNERLISTKDV